MGKGEYLSCLFSAVEGIICFYNDECKWKNMEKKIENIYQFGEMVI